MPNVDERLGSVEQRLEALAARMDERFAQVDERFAQLDQRFAQVDQRFAQVDQRFAQVDQRFAQVDQRFDSLDADVRGLRILGEQNATDIKRIAEVQTHHGQRLQELVEAVAPLKDLRDFVERVAHDHEHRIAALEEAHRQNTPYA